MHPCLLSEHLTCFERGNHEPKRVNSTVLPYHLVTIFALYPLSRDRVTPATTSNLF